MSPLTISWRLLHALVNRTDELSEGSGLDILDPVLLLELEVQVVLVGRLHRNRPAEAFRAVTVVLDCGVDVHLKVRHLQHILEPGRTCQSRAITVKEFNLVLCLTILLQLTFKVSKCHFVGEVDFRACESQLNRGTNFELINVRPQHKELISHLIELVGARADTLREEPPRLSKCALLELTKRFGKHFINYIYLADELKSSLERCHKTYRSFAC